MSPLKPTDATAPAFASRSVWRMADGAILDSAIAVMKQSAQVAALALRLRDPRCIPGGDARRVDCVGRPAAASSATSPE